MWDLDTIVKQNTPKRVYEIAPGVFALGGRGDRALAVVKRTKIGQYRGVPGPRPVITGKLVTRQATKLRAALDALC